MDSYYQDISNRLKRLKLVSNSKISHLTGQNLDDYNALVRYTHMLHGTPLYPQYHSIIKQIFSDINSNNITPATVAAYFAGCLMELNNVCDPKCVNGVIAPGQNLCQYKVVLANIESYGYRFDVLHDANSDKALVYVNSQFNGFTDYEKAWLKGKNIKYINILSNNQNYLQNDNGFTNIDQVGSRNVNSSNNICLANQVQNDNTVIWLMSIIIAILGIMIGFAIIKNNKN